MALSPASQTVTMCPPAGSGLAAALRSGRERVRTRRPMGWISRRVSPPAR
jgi:hypothetical protein